MLVYFILFLFFSIPIASILFFVISLKDYRQAKKAIKETAEQDLDALQELKKRKILLIVSSAIAGVLVAVVVGISVLFYLAIAFM